MKHIWKVSQSENRGCSSWVYEVLYVFFLHASIRFVFSPKNVWVFFFFLTMICVLDASLKLFWKALHIMKFNLLKTSVLSRPNSVGCR